MATLEDVIDGHYGRGSRITMVAATIAVYLAYWFFFFPGALLNYVIFRETVLVMEATGKRPLSIWTCILPLPLFVLSIVAIFVFGPALNAEYEHNLYFAPTPLPH